MGELDLFFLSTDSRIMACHVGDWSVLVEHRHMNARFPSVQHVGSISTILLTVVLYDKTDGRHWHKEKPFHLFMARYSTHFIVDAPQP